MERSPAAFVLVAALLLAAVPALGAATPVADRADPPTDSLGWENGYWHNDSISVDQSDGLSPAEREAFVARSMARVEYVRGLEFKRDVNVSVRSRSAVNATNVNRSAAYDAWNDQIWEALLIAGEDTDANALLAELYGGAVAGYYDPATDEIVVVAEDGAATVNNATLVHELTHALQDQYHNLSAPRYTGETQDGDLAAQGIVEGEAAYVEARYAQRCGVEWRCVPPAGGGSGGASPPNLGMYITVYQPYSDGPPYVAALRAEGGWEAVNESMAHPPNATEQTIHTTAEEPVAIRFNDTARNGWKIYPQFGENGSDTLGEASIFAGFWYQDRTYGTGVLDVDNLRNAAGPYDTYNYSASASTGWAGDRIFPYRQPETGKDGYVWKTRWDSVENAREFAAAYVRSLSAHDAELVDPNVYVVPEGPYADAFHIRREGTRVRIATAPTVEGVHDILPATAPPPSTTTTVRIPKDTTSYDFPENVTLTTMTTTVQTTDTTTATTTTTPSGPTPGFGAAVSLAALAAALALLARRGR